MKFIDKINVRIKAGDGGDGYADFIKDKSFEPSGGDGGDGGDVYFDVDPFIRTLSGIQPSYEAKRGSDGWRQNSNGAKGEDITIFLPKNTKITIDNTKTFIVEKKTKVFTGSSGAFGNIKLTKIYKSKTDKEKIDEERKIHQADKGEKASVHNVEMEMEYIAEVGLLGKPSSGKSTLISKMTNYKAKIGSYDFTTLEPSLAIASVDKRRKFAMLDLPGIIKGASLGKGKGDRVINYILKTKIILHIIDFGSSYKEPIKDFEEINNELYSYSDKFRTIKQVIIANKMDLEGSRIKLKKFKMKYPNIKILPIVALESKGVNHLLEYTWKKINLDVK